MPRVTVNAAKCYIHYLGCQNSQFRSPTAVREYKEVNWAFKVDLQGPQASLKKKHRYPQDFFFLAWLHAHADNWAIKLQRTFCRESSNLCDKAFFFSNHCNTNKAGFFFLTFDLMPKNNILFVKNYRFKTRISNPLWIFKDEACPHFYL